MFPEEAPTEDLKTYLDRFDEDYFVSNLHDRQFRTDGRVGIVEGPFDTEAL